ncbi:isoprenylcysteine carboxyl methyltransferase family protein [Allosediminivita pacifica]|uniref:Isoprenylcysteine carboxyl methyltransferase (ICMT) family protein YpbQ n=1 Tax=Allosediminivita pacifica TaxID=1267769 RepID=A0A2T6B9W6_9RHOB|nr:isoprenylcysteine carboxylmethyltransferase family protein [Allosediminivita pacifica]PTX52867.1 isoprenylcysteine carboxyl methyltransferase (ICMT) family protein YpbQ [Allosediminivita pacifica]GGA95186.1 membrane protein [Allosediminivita pacifica]
MITITFILVAGAVRFLSLGVSIRNERRLKAEGAVEHGAGTSALLAAVHVVYYLAAYAEGLVRMPPVDWVTLAGMAVWGFSICALFWVIGVLGRFWTVKLIVAKDHALTENRLFRWLRHPNYFLNILPELVGLALVLHAWWTLAIGFPVYVVILAMRIRQEERVMAETFENY